MHSVSLGTFNWPVDRASGVIRHAAQLTVPCYAMTMMMYMTLHMHAADVAVGGIRWHKRQIETTCDIRTGVFLAIGLRCLWVDFYIIWVVYCFLKSAIRVASMVAFGA